MKLPPEIISKIMLYNSSREADLIKSYWRTLDAELNLFYAVHGFAVDDTLHYSFEPLDYPRAYFKRDAMQVNADDFSWLRYTSEFLNLPRKSF